MASRGCPGRGLKSVLSGNPQSHTCPSSPAPVPSRSYSVQGHAVRLPGGTSLSVTSDAADPSLLRACGSAPLRPLGRVLPSSGWCPSPQDRSRDRTAAGAQGRRPCGSGSRGPRPLRPWGRLPASAAPGPKGRAPRVSVVGAGSAWSGVTAGGTDWIKERGSQVPEPQGAPASAQGLGPGRCQGLSWGIKTATSDGRHGLVMTMGEERRSMEGI
ncbi:translation initiation factor IF-2-like [Hyaena hyaena]|uniref:translation initiation factor IF-2-like n=1 Tax=Hyaena hyaena TaxID=95912 RepID=UPI0019218C4B|nr:translation initiation factor IF-2-like [Hyaena hyaena]